MSITPFDEAGAIDESLFRAHLRFLAEHDVGVYVASQGSGEGDLLSFAEKVTLYRIAADELHGLVPVVAAGIGLAASTATTCDLALAAEASGVDAVQIIGPRPGPLRLREDELELHFRTVIEALSCAVHVSNNTALAGYELPIAMVGRLVDDYPHVRVVNVSDPRVPELSAYVSQMVERFAARRGAEWHGARDRGDARVGRGRGVVFRRERRAAPCDPRLGFTRRRRYACSGGAPPAERRVGPGR